MRLSSEHVYDFHELFSSQLLVAVLLKGYFLCIFGPKFLLFDVFKN